MCVSVRCSVSSSRLSLSMGLDHQDTPLCCKHPTCQVVQHFTNLCRYRLVSPYLYVAVHILFFFFNLVTRYGVVMVYWNHHVLSVFVQALPRRCFLKCPTFCNQTWYCCATLHGVVSSRKDGLLFSESRSQWRLYKYNQRMTVSAISSFTTKLNVVVDLHKPKCPVKILDCWVQGQGRSKCSQFQCLSGRSLLNHWRNLL